VSKQVVKRIVVDAMLFPCPVHRCAAWFLQSSGSCPNPRKPCRKCRFYVPDGYGKGDILTLYSDGTVGHEKGAGL